MTGNKPYDLGVLCNISNINNYISTVMRLPMLTREEEFNYATRWRENGDEEALQELVLSHLRLVTSIARDYLNYNLPQADLIQEGNIGLMKAAKGFKPEHGFRFTTYAIQWIKSEINEYIIRNWRMVKVATTKAHRKLFYNMRGRRDIYKPMSAVEIDEMAERLSVPRRDVVDMEMRLAGTEFTLDAPRLDGEGEEFDNEDVLATVDTEPSQVMATGAWRNYISHDLTEALNKLNAREKLLVESRWLTDEDPTPLRVLAEEFGVSTQRVNQIEKAAINKLRSIMRDYRELEAA